MKMFMYIYKWFVPKHAYVGSMILLIFVNRHLSRHSVLNNLTNQTNDILLTEHVLKIKSRLSQEDKEYRGSQLSVIF